MTTNVSAHEDNNNSSALILVQTKYPPDPEHTPNSKFFHSDRWFRKEEIMNRGIKLLKIDTYLATGAQSSLLGFKSWVCSTQGGEKRRERERERRESWSGGQGGNPSKWSFQFIPISYLNHKST
eukprot:scaffold9511_cov120-Skeletonema_marinoi.AAC.1